MLIDEVPDYYFKLPITDSYLSETELVFFKESNFFTIEKFAYLIKFSDSYFNKRSFERKIKIFSLNSSFIRKLLYYNLEKSFFIFESLPNGDLKDFIKNYKKKNYLNLNYLK